jgi:hypothetical protein
MPTGALLGENDVREEESGAPAVPSAGHGESGAWTESSESGGYGY